MSEVALVRFAQQMLGEPFVWGQTDCAMLALRCLEAAHGFATVEQYWGLWTDEASALAHFQRELPSEVLAGIGLREVPAAQASTGDIILAPKAPFPECAHVCLGQFSLTASPVAGVHRVPTLELVDVATSAWRAG